MYLPNCLVSVSLPLFSAPVLCPCSLPLFSAPVLCPCSLPLVSAPGLCPWSLLLVTTFCPEILRQQAGNQICSLARNRLDTTKLCLPPEKRLLFPLFPGSERQSYCRTCLYSVWLTYAANTDKTTRAFEVNW
jgi:hypothetical protein